MTGIENNPDFLGAKVWRDQGQIYFDVRDLPPPDPFVATLKLLDTLEHGTVIFINDREPVHLFPELDERGWRCDVLENRDNYFRMKITKGNL